MNQDITQGNLINELVSRESDLSNQVESLEQELKDLLIEYRKHIEQKKIESLKRQLKKV